MVSVAVEILDRDRFVRLPSSDAHSNPVPQVLFPGKARDAVEVVPASTLVCCTSLIPPPPLGLTVKFTPLLATPPTVTITFPVVAPDGTEVTIVVEFQLLVVAVVPLNVTVPEDPKFFPVIVTCAPTVPEVGLKLVMEGPEEDPTVKAYAIALRARPTTTTTFPVVAPAGTVTTMLVALQLVTAPAVPLNITLLPGGSGKPNPVPVIVTAVPTGPEDGDKLVMVGNTLKYAPLLAAPPTVTTTFPNDALVGTGAVMLVDVQLVGVAGTPLNVTVLVPCVAPKPVATVIVRIGGLGSFTPRLSVTVREAR